MSDSKLDLLALDAAGLARLYADRVEPILKAQEESRHGAMRSFGMRLVGLAFVVAGVGFGVWHWSGEVFNAVIFAAVAGAFGFWIAYQPLQTVATNAKEQSLTAIADAIGCRYALNGFETTGLPHFEELRLLPSCDRADYSDGFQGNHKGCAYTFYEGHLERKVQTKNGSHWETVFRGQLIAIAFPKKFLGTTVVRRDAGMFNALARWMTTMQRVSLPDSRLEKAFEVYATDQVEARYLIHPVFMERLLTLETALKGKQLRCAFIDGELLIAVEGGDKFEVGSMFARLDDINRIRSIVSDLAEVLRVIEAVLTAETSYLPQS